MLSKKSKIFVLVGMLALLVVTGYLNVYLNNRSKTGSAATADTADFFTTYRTDRTTTRNQTMLYLDSIIESELSSKEAVAEAEKNNLSPSSFM